MSAIILLGYSQLQFYVTSLHVSAATDLSIGIRPLSAHLSRGAVLGIDKADHRLVGVMLSMPAATVIMKVVLAPHCPVRLLARPVS